MQRPVEQNRDPIIWQSTLSDMREWSFYIVKEKEKIEMLHDNMATMILTTLKNI